MTSFINITNFASSQVVNKLSVCIDKLKRVRFFSKIPKHTNTLLNNNIDVSLKSKGTFLFLLIQLDLQFISYRQKKHYIYVSICTTGVCTEDGLSKNRHPSPNFIIFFFNNHILLPLLFKILQIFSIS